MVFIFLIYNLLNRIKVLMQADRVGKYRSELNCLSDIIRTDGYIRLVTRGLDATLLREVRKEKRKTHECFCFCFCFF